MLSLIPLKENEHRIYWGYSSQSEFPRKNKNVLVREFMLPDDIAFVVHNYPDA